MNAIRFESDNLFASVTFSPPPPISDFKNEWHLSYHHTSIKMQHVREKYAGKNIPMVQEISQLATGH